MRRTWFVSLDNPGSGGVDNWSWSSDDSWGSSIGDWSWSGNNGWASGIGDWSRVGNDSWSGSVGQNWSNVSELDSGGWWGSNADDLGDTAISDGDDGKKDGLSNY